MRDACMESDSATAFDADRWDLAAGGYRVKANGQPRPHGGKLKAQPDSPSFPVASGGGFSSSNSHEAL